MALFNTIMESYSTSDEERFDMYFNEATVLLEGLFGIKYSKKDLEDPEKVKELIKQIHETPQSEFKKRGVTGMLLSLTSYIPILIDNATGFAPVLGLSILILAIVFKILNVVTEKDELTKLQNSVTKTIAALRKRLSKTNDEKEKEKLKAAIEKLEKQLNKINKTKEKSRQYWLGNGYGTPT